MTLSGYELDRTLQILFKQKNHNFLVQQVN